MKSQLILRVPHNCINERRYIYDLLLKDFLGLSYEWVFEARNNIAITCTDDREIHLLMDDSFFQLPEEQWLRPESLPVQPLAFINFNDFGLGITLENATPIIYGINPIGRPIIEINNDGMTLGVDVFGSAFFMLSRYEEAVKDNQDEHHRFPATASLAWQEGFLERPIVNEYLEILWTCLRKLWPGLQRKQRKSRFILSHDVDVPLATAFTKTSRILKSLAADIFLRKDIDLLLRRARGWCYALQGNFEHDVNNTFEMLMHISESLGIKSVFNFKTGVNSEHDEYYNISHPWVHNLLYTIVSRGHEIGFHPSYNSFADISLLKMEWTRLLQVCEECGIHQPLWGGRQHYLQMQIPETWQMWEEIGLDYDSTLGFADRVGFRCGTCYEYPAYNVSKRNALNLKERPLIAMDRSLFEYMKLPEEAITNRLVILKKTCDRYQGDFTLLWHNNLVVSVASKRYYKELLYSLAGQ